MKIYKYGIINEMVIRIINIVININELLFLLLKVQLVYKAP